MFTFLVLLFLLICMFMVLVILMQSSKGGGLASSFGGAGSTSFLGARGTANFLQKATMFLGISYGVITLLIGVYVSSSHGTATGQTDAEKAFEKTRQEMTLPQTNFDTRDAQIIGEPQEGQPAATEQGGTEEPEN